MDEECFWINIVCGLWVSGLAWVVWAIWRAPMLDLHDEDYRE